LLGVRAADNFGAFPSARSAFTHRMPYIQLSDKQYPLKVGETTVGTSGADIAVAGPAALGVQAKLQAGSDNSVIIRRASSEAVVSVNGVQLGTDPTPLIHGDKIEIGDAELLFGDDRKGGQTQALAGLKVDDVYQPRPAGSGRATAATGGRLVSLVDGREYIVSPTGISIGRDAGCDVVVPSPEVSRKHAELMAGPSGYTVTDLSTNGVFVNGERVARVRTLARGDVLRLGTEEFRFYADVAVTPPAMAAAVPAPAPAPAAPVPVVAAAAAPVATPAPAGATAAPDARPVLATLELMNEGPLKGSRFDIRVPLTHVGRGAHNDIVLSDDTVSDSHAKIQKREGGWYLVDMGSSNGTYAGGQRINGEAMLNGQSSIRFGAIRATFTPAKAARDDASGTRVIAGLSREQAQKMSREVATQAETTESSGGIPGWVWILVVVLVAAGAFFILKVR
jgi:pSer/pThr/pTyr-binding forkhead associated (FHA) protein